MSTVKRQRKSMASIVQYVDDLQQDVLENQGRLILLAKERWPFENVEWESARWNVTDCVRIRGHEGKNNKFFNFYLNVKESAKNRNKIPLSGDLANLIKATVVLRLATNNQGAENQQRFIDGWRYIYDALERKDYKLELLSVEDLSLACDEAARCLGESTAYNTFKFIHEIADLIDMNRLAFVRLSFRYSNMHRPGSVGGVTHRRLDDPGVTGDSTSSKMVDERVLQAIGYLYREIPSDEWIDRVRILLVTLCLFLGRRIGEILSMPAISVQYTDRDVAYLEYFPEKAARCDAVAPLERLVIPTKAVELVAACIDELLSLTSEARDRATFIQQHQHADYRELKDFEDREYITPIQLCEIFGLSSRSNAASWAGRRGIQSHRNPAHHNPLAIAFLVSDVKAALNNEINLRPVHTAGGKNYYHKDILAIMPLNGAQRDKCTFFYAVEQINRQHMSDFLGSNESRKSKNAKGGRVASVFERYLTDVDASDLNCNSHAFRHTLNTWLEEGGMSDAAQTKWFGRKNAMDTKAYQHMSPSKAALQVHRDLMDGKIRGPVADLIISVPVNVREVVIKARVRSVHDVGAGVCFHDFSQTPCERHLQCAANCDDYHWRADDVGRIDDVKRQYAVTMQSLKRSREYAAAGRGKAASWVIHEEKKVGVLLAQLNDLGISNFDWEAYLAEVSQS